MRLRSTLIAILYCSVAAAQSQPDITALANGYLQAFREVDFDKMGTFLHDSVVFDDLISHAEGKPQVVQNWKDAFVFKPEYIRLDVREQFTSGHFVVSDVFYEALTKIQGKNVLVRAEVFMVFQFEGDKIILLMDFPDFDALGRQSQAQLKNEIKVKDNPNVAITMAYMDAYSRWDTQTMSTFFHDSISFKDLTAKDAFKGGKFEHEGKPNVAGFWNGIFGDQRLEFVDMVVHNTFQAGSYVMLNTTLSMILPQSWTGNAPGKVYVSLPIKTALKFENGKIISQRDFADYAVYNKQIQIQTK
ncbi:MAG: nuclear transport factor 2 family protein [Cyclobacteriaceae bacterium]